MGDEQHLSPNKKSPNTPKLQRGRSLSGSLDSVSSMSLEDLSVTDLEELMTHARGPEGVEIRDRKWMLKTYHRCFVGREFVTWLVEKGYVDTRTDAVTLGHAMILANHLHHVLRDHDFKDENLFYRFLVDEDTSSKKTDHTSWAAYLPEEARQSSDGSLLPLLKSMDVDMKSRLRDVQLSPMDEHNMKLMDMVHPAGWVNPEPDGVFNFVVIGAGAAGLVTAVGSAGLGAKVALVERNLLGGDCLNIGCVPSKALIRSARAVKAVKQGFRYGVRINGSVEVDFPAIMERVRAVRAEISPHDAVSRMVDNYGIHVHLGQAKFLSKNTVEVEGKILKFAKCCIATGASAAVPNVPGLDEGTYLDNSTVFNLTALPKRLAVIGAGAVGCELAQSFAILGAEVHMFVRAESIMQREDPEAVQLVQLEMARDGVVFHFRSTLIRVESSSPEGEKTIHYSIQGGSSVERTEKFTHILVATGRKPNVEGLNLEAAGVQYDLVQGVRVNDQLQTTNSDIYAAGDICSPYKFTHAADAMARIVIRNALFFGRAKVSSLSIPWCTFTDPEIAHVGLYEADLQRLGKKYGVFRRNLDDVDRAICDGETHGFVKVLTREGKDKVVGATFVATHAGDMIGELNVLITQDIGLSALATIIHPYPTQADAIRQLGDEFNRTKLTPTVKILFRKLLAARR